MNCSIYITRSFSGIEPMPQKKTIPFGILLFAIYQFLHSLILILGGINGMFELTEMPEEALIEADLDRNFLLIMEIISVVIGVWGLNLAIRLFRLEEKARSRLVLYTKVILGFSVFLLLLGIGPMLLIALISVVALLYLNSRKVRRAFGARES